MKKTILMTGASGLVGSRFIEMYSDHYDLVNLDLTTGVDITDYSSLSSFVDNHPGAALIHLAAFTNTAEAYKQAGDKHGSCYIVNVLGTENIAKICVAKGIYLVHVSTDFVFDGTKKGLYTEEDPRTPLDWYGTTKAMAEEIVEKSECSYAIARIAYPYRAFSATKPDLVMRICAGIKDGTLPPQFSDTTITPTFIDDIAHAFQVLVDNQPTGIFHLTGTTALSPYVLAQKVASVYGLEPDLVKKGSLTDYLTNNPRPFARHVGVDNGKATRELGIRFATIDQGLDAVIHQQNDRKS